MKTQKLNNLISKQCIEFIMRSFYKLLCKIGWHKWSYSILDCIDEFGYLPIDGGMPKKAKCDRCGINNV